MKRALALLVLLSGAVSTGLAEPPAENAASIALVGIEGKKTDAPQYRFRLTNASRQSIYYFSHFPEAPMYHLERRTWLGSREVDLMRCGSDARMYRIAPGKSFEFITDRGSKIWPWRTGVYLSSTGKGDPYLIPGTYFWSPYVR